MKPLRLLPLLLLVACTTLSPQQSALINTAKPIASAALAAAAAKYGVSPETTQLVIDSLWGAAASAQSGQPVASGAATPAIGTAIAANTPAGTPDAKAALLQAAASSLTK